MTGTTEMLARYIVNARPADIPVAVEREGKRCLLHWMGCSIGGSREASVDVALAAVRELAGPGTMSVLGRSEKLDPGHAAFINGVSADVLSFSDTHPATLIHAGGVIGSAASFTVLVGLTGFEMLIQALQAYVFTLLAAVYINDAVNAH